MASDEGKAGAVDDAADVPVTAADASDGKTEGKAGEAPAADRADAGPDGAGGGDGDGGDGDGGGGAPLSGGGYVVFEGRGGQRAVRSTHSSGATVEVYLTGATVTSFVTAAGNELLFVSDEAVFNGVRGIRGGIPIVFPQFGPGELPQHGFARNSTWTLASAADGELVFSLSDNDETRAVWPHPFDLEYSIIFAQNMLSTSLAVTNTGDAPFEMQALLHTYYNVPAVEEVRVSGFKGVTYIDKVADMKEAEEDRDEVALAGETDRIYKNVPGALVLKGVSRAGGRVVLNRGVMAGDDEDDSPSDVVLWNPWVDKSKAMGDFGDEEYHKMVCVEPGLVSEKTTLAPGGEWMLSQSIVDETDSAL